MSPTTKRWVYILGGVAVGVLLLVALLRMIHHFIDRQYGGG